MLETIVEEVITSILGKYIILNKNQLKISLTKGEVILTNLSLQNNAFDDLNLPIDIISISIKQSLEDLGKITGDNVGEDIINEITTPTLVMGDGAIKNMPALAANKNILFAPPHLNMPSAASVCIAAMDEIKENGTKSPDEVNAVYIRKSQAEQERERMNKK